MRLITALTMLLPTLAFAEPYQGGLTHGGCSSGPVELSVMAALAAATVLLRRAHARPKTCRASDP